MMITRKKKRIKKRMCKIQVMANASAERSIENKGELENEQSRKMHTIEFMLNKKTNTIKCGCI